mmetsp:Transcript_45993/g.99993  ORF Transcript_45993/g.99993 Transcript_45993/m.99993 type:complete len:224 (+) Transcript_45993:272-943(+)
MKRLMPAGLMGMPNQQGTMLLLRRRKVQALKLRMPPRTATAQTQSRWRPRKRSELLASGLRWLRLLTISLRTERSDLGCLLRRTRRVALLWSTRWRRRSDRTGRSASGSPRGRRRRSPRPRYRRKARKGPRSRPLLRQQRRWSGARSVSSALALWRPVRRPLSTRRRKSAARSEPRALASDSCGASSAARVSFASLSYGAGGRLLRALLRRWGRLPHTPVSCA